MALDWEGLDSWNQLFTCQNDILVLYTEAIEFQNLPWLHLILLPSFLALFLFSIIISSRANVIKACGGLLHFTVHTRPLCTKSIVFRAKVWRVYLVHRFVIEYRSMVPYITCGMEYVDKDEEEKKSLCLGLDLGIRYETRVQYFFVVAVFVSFIIVWFLKDCGWIKNIIPLILVDVKDI